MDAVGLAHCLGVGVAAGIVIAEGRLLVDVYIVYVGHAAGQLTLEQLRHIAFPVLTICGHDRERLVVGVKAGVQDGHNGAGAVVAQLVGLVGAHHAGRAGHGDGVLVFAEGGGQAVLLGHKDPLHAVQLPGPGDVTVGHLHGEAVEDGGVGILQVGSAVHRLGGYRAAPGPDLRLDGVLGAPQLPLQGHTLGGGRKALHIGGSSLRKGGVFQFYNDSDHVAVLILIALASNFRSAIL